MAQTLAGVIYNGNLSNGSTRAAVEQLRSRIQIKEYYREFAIALGKKLKLHLISARPIALMNLRTSLTEVDDSTRAAWERAIPQLKKYE